MVYFILWFNWFTGVIKAVVEAELCNFPEARRLESFVLGTAIEPLELDNFPNTALDCPVFLRRLLVLEDEFIKTKEPNKEIE